MERRKPKIYEDEAIVLDVFTPERPPKGVIVGRKWNMAHLLGTSHFTLLEAVFNPSSITLKTGSKVYIGKEVSRDVLRIVRRISYGELSESAKMELEQAVETIVKENEERFVRFFNDSGPLTPRLHSLEVIPGVGKKMLLKILNEREVELFKSFEDIQSRIGLSEPVKAVTKRVVEELRNPDNRHWLFVRPPSEHGP
ncbi:MAG: DUF655 domain-containing protein [Aigarchaeota archaeon]|nr:DUF655 domain-containing protein [Aigarchaeota archaeon]MDW8092667.1 DUF655 domain-containing protein [Nitrososphaerota archaeon]